MRRWDGAVGGGDYIPLSFKAKSFWGWTRMSVQQSGMGGLMVGSPVVRVGERRGKY